MFTSSVDRLLPAIALLCAALRPRLPLFPPIRLRDGRIGADDFLSPATSRISM